ncbi:MAG: hypothetical protein PVF20_09910 [Desulfobacterales bacterium]|jgi:hypothetical protein
MIGRACWAAAIIAGLTAAAMATDARAVRSVDAIKADILELSIRYIGQGDPGFDKQQSLDVLVEELISVAPQPPVKERLHLIAGPWKQIWGPYDYRNDDRGVDPKTTVDEIYQVVFEEGYYYNINPIKGKNTIALLRGEYTIVPQFRDMLKIRFTRFPGNKGRPADLNLWDLAALAEAGRLPNETTIVPSFIVRWFFGGGGLREVYTDQNMRITYGAGSVDDREDEFIYVMTRPE